MENKYYTPELSEFHVGFEYEIQHTDPPFEWESHIFTIDDYDWAAMSDENMSLFRVKYLDKQDIEDCGFEVQHIEQDGDVIYFEQIGKPHNQIVFHKYSGVHYKNGKYGDGFITLNIPKRLSGNIYIKNKSELKKLLKQLGI